MTALVFDTSTYKWDSDRYAMAFVARDGDKRVLCLISGEALLGHFGAMGTQAGMENAFLNHRDEIEARARMLYRRGQTDEQGRVLLRSGDFGRHD